MRRAWLSLLCPLSLFAQAAGPLTLEDCVRLAWNAPSSVTRAQQETLIARYGITQARAGFLPGLTVANGYTYNSPTASGNFFVGLNGLREYSTLVQTGFEADTSGRLRAELARARANLAVAGANLNISRRDLRRLVAASYYRVLLARKLVQVNQDTLGEAERFEDRTKKLFAGGEAAQADVIKAGADAALLRQALSRARSEAALANHELAAYWTADVGPELNLAEVLDAAPPPPPAEPNAQPFLRRPEFSLYDAQRTGFLADARRARADLLPQAGAQFEWGIDSYRYSFADRGYAAIIHLNVPVFDWFKTRSAVRQFRLQADQVSTDRAIAQRTFSREYQDALTRLRGAFEELDITGQQVQLSTDNLRLAQVRYQGGEGLALDVVAAQNQLAQARTNFFSVRADYWNARADLEVASGQ